MSSESISGILDSSLASLRGQQQQTAPPNGSAATAAASTINYWPRMDGLHYTDYFRKLEENIASFRLLWRNEQRLEALKLACQLAKLLADTSQVKLYSKKHKMITNMLNELGELISARIKQIASGQSSSRTQSSASGPTRALQAAANHERAREMCRNWFLKVAAIPELVPKFYIELAILNTCEPLLSSPSAPDASSIDAQATHNFYNQSLRRFIKTSWALADPIVALHSRAYLCSRAKQLLRMSEAGAAANSLSATCLADLVSINILDSAKLVTYLDSNSALMQTKSSELDQWFELVCSPIESMIGLATLETTSNSLNGDSSQELAELFTELLGAVSKDTCSPLGRCIVLNATCRALPDDHIALQSNKIFNLLLKSQESCKVSKSGPQTAHLGPIILITMESFAIALLSSDYFERHVDSSYKLALFKSIDSILSNLFDYCRPSSTSDPDSYHYVHLSYLRCFKAWVYYANSYTNLNTLDLTLDKFVSSVKKNIHLTDQLIDSMVFDIIKNLLANKKTADELSALFKLKSIWKLIELFPKDNYKLASTSWILETLKSNLKLTTGTVQINQTLLIDSILKIFQTLNKCLGLLVNHEDIERLSSLIICYLDRISIADFRKRLNFYTKCRANLTNLNPVVTYLTKLVLKLPVEFRDVERKRNARQDYLNGCLAFAYVTIPAIQDTCTRLNLFIEGTDLALSHLSISLAHYYWQKLILNLEEHIRFGVFNGLDNKFVVRAGLTGNLEINDDDDDSSHELGHILPIVRRALDVMVKHQDHIDNEHKISLKLLIEENFQEISSLANSLKFLDVIKSDELD